MIFITENDVLKAGKPIYRIERIIEETGEHFNDGEHIVYVNGQNRDSMTALGKLMHDFFCTNPADMHYKELAEKARYFKEDEKGVKAMCKVIEDMRKETEKETKIEGAQKLIELGVSLEIIAKGLSLPLEEVSALAGAKTA